MEMITLEKLFVNSERHSRQVSRHAERLVRYTAPQPGQTYLDVGCGNGAAPIHIAKTFGMHVTGIDIDADQIAIALRNGATVPYMRFMTGDSTNLPFEDGEFQVVFTNKVTHHVSNWRQAVVEMLRVLAPGGYFIYADLIVPAPIACVGQAMLGRLVGFPTRAALDEIATAHNLSSVYRSITPIHYEAVFQNRTDSHFRKEM